MVRCTTLSWVTDHSMDSDTWTRIMFAATIVVAANMNMNVYFMSMINDSIILVFKEKLGDRQTSAILSVIPRLTFGAVFEHGCSYHYVLAVWNKTLNLVRASLSVAKHIWRSHVRRTRSQFLSTAGVPRTERLYRIRQRRVYCGKVYLEMKQPVILINT
jgi:hypothetical protein